MERERRRAQILEIAKAVFAEKGYHEAKIDDFVARAKVARGTFYLYFGDKRAIFEEIVDTLMVQISHAIQPIRLTEHAPSAVEQLTDNINRVVRLFTEDPAMAKILFSDAVGLDPDFDRRLLAFYDGLSQMIGRSLDTGVRAGIVRPGDNRVRSYCLIGIVKELLYQYSIRHDDIDPDRTVKTVIEMVADGILTDAARGKRHDLQ